MLTYTDGIARFSGFQSSLALLTRENSRATGNDDNP